MIERLYRMFKDSVQPATLEQEDLRTAATRYLGGSRATPHSATGISPVMLLHGRQHRTKLSLVGRALGSGFTQVEQQLCHRVQHQEDLEK